MGMTYSTNDDDEEGIEHDELRSEVPVPQHHTYDSFFHGSSSSSMLGPSWLMNDATQSTVFGDASNSDITANALASVATISESGTNGVVGAAPSPQTGRPLFSLDEVFQASNLQTRILHNRSSSGASSPQFAQNDDYTGFHLQASRHYEWMGRSIESLILGQRSLTPILALPEEEDYYYQSDNSSHTHDASRRASLECIHRSSLDFITRRSSLDATARGSIHLMDLHQLVDSSRGSLSNAGSSHHRMHGGTLANYYNHTNRRTSNGMDFPNISNHRVTPRRHRVSISSRSEQGAGPNITLSLLAREITGYCKKAPTATHRLTKMGGQTLYQSVDKPAGGMMSEVKILEQSVQCGDWTETAAQISRLAPRLIGDGSTRGASIDDPNVPATASPYYAGGGRLGLERDAFCLAGGVEVLISIFRSRAFLGEGQSNDARDLPTDLVANRLAGCWNEVLASLRELVFALPVLVKDGTILENGDFLPFLFTLLSHDSVFDCTATLIEEILSLQSHAPPPTPTGNEEEPIDSEYRSMNHMTPVSTFFLGNVPDLYQLWRGFNCRQLAHFCRILALLVFEPEDRQLLESPALLKSLELLQLRRDRAARAGRDSTVDMNQSILLGDRDMVQRLLQLLKVMNYAPTLRRSSAYHVMAHFPFIGDTLVMLGLSEIDNWKEIDRLERLSRKLITRGDSLRNLSDLGSVTDMLESLAGPLLRNPAEPPTQLGHIIHVINAAQQAGVVVGGQRHFRRQREGHPDHTSSAGTSAGAGHSQNSAMIDPSSLDNFATAAMTLTDQVMLRRAMFASPNGDESALLSSPTGIAVDSRDISHMQNSSRLRINTPEDAANELQFNALLLAPYQVEVLFVLCTLLGGRRKIDAQNFLDTNGLMSTLDEMFHRLTWGPNSNRRRSTENSRSANAEPSPASALPGSASNGETSVDQSQAQSHGIHGPGCECTPESALSIQYLRLLHNFCDRDCDNYTARRLLLSSEERNYIFSEGNTEANPSESPELSPGLFTKMLGAFMQESDDSPYRFWLASCAESYLRGSSPQEQLFAARSGLLIHLVEDIISGKLHCAGSLQTSFDLLGELCKGNPEVLHLLVSTFDEDTFRRIMSAAAENLVDSNVFIRSLLLTIERIAAAKLCKQYEIERIQQPLSRFSNSEYAPWSGKTGEYSRFYLTHSWWDVPTFGRQSYRRRHPGSGAEVAIDKSRSSDWFPFRPFRAFSSAQGLEESTSFNSSVGYNGWVFSPDQLTETLGDATYSPNTIERMSWFLTTNQARLLRDLLGVVDLRNINHENICCLNTAVVVAIFAYRRAHLAGVLSELRRMSDDEKERRRSNSSSTCVEVAYVADAMSQLELEGLGRRRSIGRNFQSTTGGSSWRISTLAIYGDRNDVLRNFRELLWFWSEYYKNRGRDRLSLEFSSHLRFQEWIKVVNLLGADDGSNTSLTRQPIRLPKSPYRRAPLLRNV